MNTRAKYPKNCQVWLDEHTNAELEYLLSLDSEAKVSSKIREAIRYLAKHKRLQVQMQDISST
jgi:hypothetical protein